jgi:predicted nuclease of restriction endonuclease-like (RecB) superfamily
MDKKYLAFINELKQNIVQSRYVAARLVNREQLLLYYQVGRNLSEKIKAEKWGAQVMEEIASDLQKQLPGLRGFSHGNLKRMRQFYEVYAQFPIGSSLTSQLEELAISPSLTGQIREEAIGQSAAAQLQNGEKEAFMGISFTHHMLILVKCSATKERWFYIFQAASQAWSVRTLEHHIDANLYKNQGQLVNNFKQSLPDKLSANALQVFKDEYLFDFLQLDEQDGERVFEGQVVANIKNTIMALGKGFAFIGNQYRLELDGQEFFIDLLFYNRYLQCLVAFELKSGKFKPEYAGQLNFYLNVLDDKVKLPDENPSIGIILCKEKNNTVVEYAFKNIGKGMGAATFKVSKEVPTEMKGILPDANDLSNLL